MIYFHELSYSLSLPLVPQHQPSPLNPGGIATDDMVPSSQRSRLLLGVRVERLQHVPDGGDVRVV